MKRMTSCLSLLCFMVFGPPAVALGDGMSAVSRAPATSIQAYGAANACTSWTDGCTLCMRGGGCSTPGIACTPSAITCTAP